MYPHYILVPVHADRIFGKRTEIPGWSWAEVLVTTIIRSGRNATETEMEEGGMSGASQHFWSLACRGSSSSSPCLRLAEYLVTGKVATPVFISLRGGGVAGWRDKSACPHQTPPAVPTCNNKQQGIHTHTAVSLLGFTRIPEVLTVWCRRRSKRKLLWLGGGVKSTNSFQCA